MSCTFNNNEEVLAKVREKGFSNQAMDHTYNLSCSCGNTVVMKTFETRCESCQGIFVVTPCSQELESNIVFVS